MVMKLVNVILLILILHTTVDGGAEAGSQKQKRLSIEEDGELSRQLNILNKPPIKSFKDKNGDIIDCIDIYKQPAFDHPLLKDHKLQRKPSVVPKVERGQGGYSRLIELTDQRVSVKCPYGTVPLKRVKKEDLVRANQSLNLRRPRSISPTTPAPDGHYAAVTTLINPSWKVYGAGTSISVYNLTTIENPLISEALLWIGSGTDGSYSSIEYGWTVNPNIYGDSQSRTYSFWTADGLQSTGCFNAMCSGYVQVSRKRIMGEVLPATLPGSGEVHVMDFKLFKDRNTSNWWLFENLGNNEYEPIGYWPESLLPAMSESAAVVQIGGKVSSPLTKATPMGSGEFVPDDFTRTCYASNIKFVDSDYKFYTPGDVPMQVVADVPDVYRADYLGDASEKHPQQGYSVLFGGPLIS